MMVFCLRYLLLRKKIAFYPNSLIYLQGIGRFIKFVFSTYGYSLYMGFLDPWGRFTFKAFEICFQIIPQNPYINLDFAGVYMCQCFRFMKFIRRNMCMVYIPFHLVAQTRSKNHQVPWASFQNLLKHKIQIYTCFHPFFWTSWMYVEYAYMYQQSAIIMCFNSWTECLE